MTLQESSIKRLDQISKDHPEKDKVDILIEMAESPRPYLPQSQYYYQTDQVECLLEAVKIMRQRELPETEETKWNSPRYKIKLHRSFGKRYYSVFDKKTKLKRHFHTKKDADAWVRGAEQ